MYIVMFEFVVKPGKTEAFLAAWPKVTQGIYLFKGSLGSRLHKSDEGKWIAYAQWPSKQVYEQAASISMSEDYEAQRAAMHDALNLEHTKTLYQMDVEVDYFQRRPFAVA